jgi:glycine cleavage system H protein
VSDDLRYRRNKFAGNFPAAARYTRSHAWLAEDPPGRWRVGLTGFATRMLGEVVEFGFDVPEGAPVKTSDVIGYIEGFKAVSDLFCVADGVFEGANPVARADPALIWAKPHHEGWLYAVRGTPDPEALDVHAYVAFLDETIDRMAKGAP